MDKMLGGAVIKQDDKEERMITAYANRPILDWDREIIRSVSHINFMVYYNQVSDWNHPQERRDRREKNCSSANI